MQRQTWRGNINANKGVDNEYKKKFILMYLMYHQPRGMLRVKAGNESRYFLSII